MEHSLQTWKGGSSPTVPFEAMFRNNIEQGPRSNLEESWHIPRSSFLFARSVLRGPEQAAARILSALEGTTDKVVYKEILQVKNANVEGKITFYEIYIIIISPFTDSIFLGLYYILPLRLTSTVLHSRCYQAIISFLFHILITK